MARDKLAGKRQGKVVLGWKSCLGYDMFVILSCVSVYHWFSDDISFIICLLLIINHLLPYGVIVFHWVGLGFFDLLVSAAFITTWHFAKDCSVSFKWSLLVFSTVTAIQKRLPTQEMKYEKEEAAVKETKRVVKEVKEVAKDDDVGKKGKGGEMVGKTEDDIGKKGKREEMVGKSGIEGENDVEKKGRGEEMVGKTEVEGETNNKEVEEKKDTIKEEDERNNVANVSDNGAKNKKKIRLMGALIIFDMR